MVVAGCLKADPNRMLEIVEVIGKAAKLDRGAGQDQALARPPAWRIDQDLMAHLGYIDGYQNCGCLGRLGKGHGGSVAKNLFTIF